MRLFNMQHSSFFVKNIIYRIAQLGPQAQKLVDDSLVRPDALDDEFFKIYPLNWEKIYKKCIEKDIQAPEINAPWQLIAFAGKKEELIEFFSKKPELLNARHRPSGRTPLSYAQWGENIEGVEWLRQHCKPSMVSYTPEKRDEPAASSIF